MNRELIEQNAIYDEKHVLDACLTGCLVTIQQFLEQHKIDQCLHTGWTLLLHASSLMQSEIMEYLLTHGANPNAHKDGFTPLMALCTSTKGTNEVYLKCLQLLIQAKAEVNVTNKQRETALMYACKFQDADFVIELMKHVKHVDTRDSDGRTALSYAAMANKIDNVKILLQHNVDVSIIDRYNLTAKDIAHAKGFVEISALLTDDEEDALAICEISQFINWKDLFSDLFPKNTKVLDYDISCVLHGMGLERYGPIFLGMEFKTFLQLTEHDLCNLGIDISVHREQFLESLEKFHNKKWNNSSIGIIKQSLPYTIYNGVTSLGNARKQISVITSSFQYIKNDLLKAADENVYLTSAHKMEYEQELKNTRETIKTLKNEIISIRELAKKIDKENHLGTPATYISRHVGNDKYSWTITLSILSMVGLYLYKTTHIQGLWNRV